jgi:hypothetical protein
MLRVRQLRMLLLLLRSIALAAMLVCVDIPAAIAQLCSPAAAAVCNTRLPGPDLSLLLLHARCCCCDRCLQVR